MRIRWRSFELPTRVIVEEDILTETYGKFIAEPFEHGFGITVGNSLRRVLLSSLEGTAVTSLKFEGVTHEFATIPGVYEDITQIILNVKQLLIKIHGDGPVTLRLDAKGEGPATAGQITCDQNAEIVSGDLVIANLVSEDAELHVEMIATKGRGYVTSDENANEELEKSVIPIDSIFSPVQRVRYRTENTRVGKLTNYDRLILEIWTDGTVSPDMAMVEASKILRKHLNPFVQYYDLGEELEVQVVEGEEMEPPDEGQQKLIELLNQPIGSLDLSLRAQNCIETESIKTLGDLCRRTEAQMLEIRNFGKTSLREIKKKLASLELELGMDVEAICKE